MILDETVLVLGAGASAPYGLPLGKDLKAEVKDLGNYKNSETGKALLDAGIKEGDIRTFYSDLANLDVTSIDTFLEERKELREVGKAFIAHRIIVREREGQLRGNWYQELFTRLRSDCPKEKFGDNKLKIVTFNYDRSIEYYLFCQVKWFYGINDVPVVADLIRKIEVLHLHGVLGNLNPLDPNGRPFSTNAEPKIIQDCMKKIKVISKEADDKDYNQAREWFKLAKKVIFIGWGYHSDSLNKLKQGDWINQEKKVIGTAQGISQRKKNEIQAAIPRVKFHGGDAFSLFSHAPFF